VSPLRGGGRTWLTSVMSWFVGMQVKAGQRPPIPDSCIPAYRQLIEDCWAQHPGTYHVVLFLLVLFIKFFFVSIYGYEYYLLSYYYYYY
jgi:hypothetical protein